MVIDSEYMYYIDGLNGYYIQTAFSAEFPLKWNVPQENNIIFPIVVEYKYQNVEYSLAFNPNIYTRSGTQTVSDSRIVLSFNYSNNQVTINKATSATGQFDYDHFFIMTIDNHYGYNDFPIVYAEPQDKTKAIYNLPMRDITVAGISYLVQGIEYSNCANMTTPLELSPNLLKLAFYKCTSLTTAPVIPDNIINMDYCFEGCTSLTGDIYIYSQQLDYPNRCFYDTTLPITLHAMNNNVEVCEQLASTANNNNVYINTTPTTLPSTIECTPMNYQTDNGLVQLSPQTDASLVSVQVPNGSGTITTTLEDALIDLYSRTPSIGTSITQPITVSGVTFTPLGDGSIRVDGTATELIEQAIISSKINIGGIYSATGFSDVVIRSQQSSNCTIYYSDYSTLWMRCSGDGRTISIPTYSYTSEAHLKSIRIRTYIPYNTTFNNVIIKPKLRLVGDK